LQCKFNRAIKKMNILLTFTGFHDPYSIGLVGQEEQPGPILSLARAYTFDRIILFSTPNTENNTAKTQLALQNGKSSPAIEIRHIPLADPTEYFGILAGLREHFREISECTDNANYFISVTSGTPQMHACWLMLAASGEIPAHILNVRPHRFVSKDRPLIAEVDLTSREFPSVRFSVGRVEALDDPPPDINIVISQLGIVGDHPKIMASLESGAMLAQSNVPVLILGETGTGKELFARFIHHLSGRAKDSFVPLNCAAIPKELAESLLFGHKKGAFTGAISNQDGKFVQADGGTLFLDELGELPMAAQTKLLRVLQDGIVESLGAKTPRKVNVRIVAATNQNLKKAIKRGQFREDLYYRLNVGEIMLPPLRERKNDIPKIALHVLDRVNSGLKKPKRLSQKALARLQRHDWPGNVRDLQNAIERSILMARKDVLDADDLLISEPADEGDPLSLLPEPHEGFSLEEFLSGARKQLMLRALEMAGNNQSEAARLLGVSPQAVHKFLQSGRR
jgi:transcriptional regulator with PAS, ATPase and Fis domain